MAESEMDVLLRRYYQYLKLEKGFSENTLDAYERDLRKFLIYTFDEGIDVLAPRLEDFQSFAARLDDIGISAASRKRILVGIHSFYTFLYMTDRIAADPMALFEFPSLPQHLPDVLSVEEIDRIEAAIDVSTAEGHRNRAIVEVLFSCGLRVSELCNLRMEDLYLEEGFIRVNGKGSKQRLVPISRRAVDELRLWFSQRVHITPKRGEEDFVFLSARPSACRASRCSASSRRPWRQPASTRPSARTRSATPSPQPCWRAGPTCAPSRPCWGTRASAPPRSTCTPTPRACGRKFWSITRER